MYGVGDIGGESVHTLTTAEVPPHSHSGTTDGDSPDHTHVYGTAGAKNGFVSVTGAFAWIGADVGVATGGASTRHTHTYTTTSVGGGGAHENRPPYMAFYPIFKLC